MADCNLLNPLRRDGTSQRQRVPAALSPDSVQIDGRTTADLLLYAREFAKLVRYYDQANEPAADWVDFIERDVSTLAAMIGAYDGDAPNKQFKAAKERAEAAPADAFGGAYNEMFAPIFSVAETIDGWRKKSTPRLLLYKALDRFIASLLAEALQDTVRYAKRGIELGLAIRLPDLERFDTRWGDLQVPADTSLFPSDNFSDSNERLRAVRLLSRAYERFHEASQRLVADAPSFLRETLELYPEHQPHAALFLAVLELLGRARDALNTLTARHLDFYFQEVLRLGARPAVADRVHLVFQLAKGIDRFRLAEGTLLDGGKDTRGVPLVYGTDTELVVNPATLDPKHGVKTVFVDRGADGVVRNIYAAPDADSADGLGAPLQGDEPRWDTFGSMSMPHARVGFALASPLFWLAEGRRTLTLRFALDDGGDGFLCGRSKIDVERELRHNVRVQATGEKGFIDCKVVEVEVSDRPPRFLKYVIRIAPDAPAVVAIDAAVHGESYDTRHPVLRFVLESRGMPGELLETDPPPTVTDYSDDVESYEAGALVYFEGRLYQARVPVEGPGFKPTAHPETWGLVEYAYAYKYFERMRVMRAELGVHVEGMRSLVLENDFGVLNPAKPFYPFGPMPRQGSAFLIGCAEVLGKSPSELTLKFEWQGLPTSFVTLYAGYAGAPRTDQDFTATFELLSGGRWQTLNVKAGTGGIPTSSPSLFETSHSSLSPSATFVIDTMPGDSRSLGDDAPKPVRYATHLRRGFLRVVLHRSFLHETYPAELAEFAKQQGGTAPNPPYTPALSAVTVDYVAARTVNYDEWTRSDVEARVERLFHLGPFGHQEIAPVREAIATAGLVAEGTLVPEFESAAGAPSALDAEGTLYIGIAGLMPPQDLSLLFQMAEGSEDPTALAQRVHWSYLTSPGWVDFLPAEVVSDTTNGLIGSGIIKLAVPETAAHSSTMLPVGLHWLRATVERGASAIPKAIAIHPHAVRASLRDERVDPPHLSAPLVSGRITKLKVRQSAVKSVQQPYASFGGRPRETDDAFRMRVAERLRHKHRPIAIFDYERLVLDRFPEVYKVRCINHTNSDSEHAPGCVLVVVVPNLRNKNAVDPLRPRLALAKLSEIKSFLEPLASDFVTLEVVNPQYEEVRVRFNVRFRSGYDKGYYTGELEGDIIRFLSPWAYDESVDLTFGGRIHRSAILNFIDERPYVDFVTDFRMDHIVGGDTYEDVERAETRRSSAVLVSARHHGIGDDIVSCEDPPMPKAPEPPPAPPAPPLPPGRKRYLGNVHTRELHDLLRITPMCQIDEISIDRRYPFARIEDARALKYDFCAYCFGRAASER